MADYRDLLRRAIEALPENNGNARRQVYDKARAALRKQLDAIQPELPSREKTHHRLQLEECIREVEQEATERILSGLSQLELDPEDFASPEVSLAEPEPEPEIDDGHELTDSTSDDLAPAETEAPEPVAATSMPGEPAEDQAESGDVEPPAPAEEAPAEAEPAETGTPAEAESGAESETEAESIPAPEAEDGHPASEETAAAPAGENITPEEVHETPSAEAAAGEIEVPEASEPAETLESVPPPSAHVEADVAEAAAVIDAAAAASKQNAIWSRFTSKPATAESGGKSPAVKAEPAMSSEREVELDGDPQTAIDHAIAVLDREAGGGALSEATIETTDPDLADLGFARTEAENEGGSSPALTIFLVLVLLLLAGAGGASYWAWREGYLDLSNLFGGDTAATVSQTAMAPDSTASTPPTEPIRQIDSAASAANGTETVEPSGPGNTAATPDVVETPATGLQQADTTGTDTTGTAAAANGDALALAPTDTGSATMPAMDEGSGTVGNTTTPAATTNGGAADAATAANAAANVAEPAAEDKTEDRLPVADAANAATPDSNNQATSNAEAMAEGSQSLLLEASDQANAGAVPFSGTVEWTRGVDELGQPTLQATANIPARNMSVSLLIRKNSDPSLPASHLIEIDFKVSDSFIGGGIARIAGILMKNEELVQGVPLVGASARVVGNNFLFALSAARQDVTSNEELLRSRKWMDLAIIYSTGKQAILTLEKDDKASALFDEVMAVWSPPPAATTDTAPAATGTPATTDAAPAHAAPATP